MDGLKMSLTVTAVHAGYGKFPVLKDVTFSVEKGEICGLIGLNGAGKSTTIKTIMGFLSPTSGSVLVDGCSLEENPKQYRLNIAFIPETPVLYEELTLREHLELTAQLYGQQSPETMGHALKLVKLFRLTHQLDLLPIYFSKGMQQKVLLICALMLDVPLYVIDEPFLGLDPLGIQVLLTCLTEKKEKGATILMSTHVLDTAQRTCDRFVVLHDGCVKVSGTLEQLRKQAGGAESLEEIYFNMTMENAYETTLDN